MYKIICCQCGKEFLDSHKTRKFCSELCYSNYKCRDITNQRFGKLVAIKREYIRNRRAYWLCKCDCGNYTVAVIDSLLYGSCKSCGCLLRDFSSNNTKNNPKIIEYRNSIFKENTNLNSLKNTKYKSNKSGVRGVCWHKRFNKWSAYITVKKKVYNLGRFENIEDAIKARKEAEEKYFKPILDKYKKEVE